MKVFLLIALGILSAVSTWASDIVEQLGQRVSKYSIAPNGEIKGKTSAVDPTLEWEIAQYINKNIDNSAAIQKLAATISSAAKRAATYDGKYLAALVLGRIGSDSDISLLTQYLGNPELFPAGRNALEMLASPAAIQRG